MAYTLAEVQLVLTNLKATYLKLTTKTASELTMRDRQIVMQQMADVRKEIEEWEAREQLLGEGTDGQAGGVAYANFQRPS